jgi:cell division septum initiation protein DivIVA
VTQLLETMARDLANVQQEVEQLKAGQEELVRENARTAQQLKESQEQIARAGVNASEQNRRPNLQPRTSATPPPPIATPARKPASAPPPTQARAQARAPVQLLSGQR